VNPLEDGSSQPPRPLRFRSRNLDVGSGVEM
jgi:hypothetical protein